MSISPKFTGTPGVAGALESGAATPESPAAAASGREPFAADCESPTPLARGVSRTTVIVATYNRCEFLDEALRSLLDQTLAPARIVVVDDGSTDKTRAVVEAFGARVEYRRQPNRGKASALNAALATVGEELIWIFDDDDVAEADALEQMVSALDSRPDCAFAYGAYDTFRSTSPGALRTYVRGSMPEREPASLLAALLELCFVFQGAMLVRRSAYEAVGLFDESLVRSQDYEMLLRLARRFKGARIESVLFHQRQHAGQRGTAAAPVAARRLDAALRYYDLKIFPALFEALDLSEYGSASEDLLVRLARRAVIFARKDLWREATQGLIDYLEEAERRGVEHLTPAEFKVFRSCFDLYSRGDLTRSRPFQDALVRVRPKQLRGEIRAAMLNPLNYRLRRAIVTANRDEFLRYLRTFFLLSCRISLTLHLWRTARLKATYGASLLGRRALAVRR